MKFCSDACRRTSKAAIHAKIESSIVSMLRERAAGATICPSEVARVIAPSDWRPLMEPTRAAARRLAAAGAIVVTQRGVIIDASKAKGPIRLRLK